MLSVNYQKRKNSELLKSLEDPKFLFLSNAQNYIPIYTRFFSLNETNYNSINLNHKYYISNILSKTKDSGNIYKCQLKNLDNNKTKERKAFVKIAPLLDSFKYLVGKYNIADPTLFQLPKYNSDETNTHTKVINSNNSSYVDGFFLFLSSNLIYHHDFLHGVDFYGSFLAIKKNFTVNIFDDIEYLHTSEFFKNNKDRLFTTDNYDHLLNENIIEKKEPIKIEHNISSKSVLSAKSFKDIMFEDIFEENNMLSQDNQHNCELVDITNDNLLHLTNSREHENNFSLKSSSTCSSRYSYTSNENEDNDNSVDDKNNTKCENNVGDNYDFEDNEDNAKDNAENNEEDEGDEEDYDDEDDEYDEEEIINATIPEFPVEVIFMENCENTFDDLILSNELTDEEWFSAFMQVIMILITYQKSFSFTHNDLHTNNVMYTQTDKKYLYYCYKKKYYKVPTFGRIFKIIDFGRSIYKFNGQLFCSDSFQSGGDASTQYNTEPFFNEKKPRLEPNFSFDLCRLACSIFDHIIDDIRDVKDINALDPVRKIVVEWCLDDKGINLLYKNNGDDRYPDFKLYKMIARCVHNHTPQAQLERPEFKKYIIFDRIERNNLIDIDSIPVYV